MIIKRIRKGPLRRRGSFRKLAGRVRDILAYVVNADVAAVISAEGIEALTGYALDQRLRELGVEPGEKVIASGQRNLEAGTLVDLQAQIIATASRCPRSKDPVEHIVMSWQCGEKPDKAQMVEAVEMMVDLLGCRRNQIVWAAHGNTTNVHIHVVINRVDPSTGKITQLGDGWDKDRLMQVCALIEYRQGWMPEHKGVYMANDQGIFAVLTERKVRDADGNQLRRAGDRANDRKALLAGRDLADLAAALRTTSWQGVHAELAKYDAMLMPKGSGAVVIDCLDQAYKASYFGADCAWGSLIERLGSYEPPADGVTPLEGHAEHQAQIVAENKRIRDARADAWRRLQQQTDVNLQMVRDIVRDKKKRAVLEQAILTEAAAVKAALAAEFDRNIAEVDRARITASEWVKGRRGHAPKVILPSIVFPQVPTVDEGARWQPAGYDVVDVAGGRSYMRHDKRRAAFVDYGLCIIVYAQSDGEVLDALKLAAARWDTIAVRGDRRFEEQCERLAAKHGIAVQTTLSKPVPIKHAITEIAPPTLPLSAEVRVQTPAPPPSTYPFIYVTKAEAPAMKAAVRALGLEVGMQGTIGFDRQRRTFFIDEATTSPAAREALKRILGRYMTVEAQALWRSQLELVDAAASTPANTNRPTTPAATVSPFLKPPQPPSVGPTTASASTSDASPTRFKPIGTPVNGVRRLGSEELAVIKGLDERPNPDHPLIKAWFGILPDRVAERRAAAAAIVGDALANYGLNGVEAKLRKTIESQAHDHKRHVRREMLSVQRSKTLGSPSLG